MSEEETAIAELKQMSKEELDLVDYDKLKWVCSGKGCVRGTNIRDYGIGPVYYHPRKSIGFFDVNSWYWMCEFHFKLQKRLLKNYPIEDIQRKVFDLDKLRLSR